MGSPSRIGSDTSEGHLGDVGRRLCPRTSRTSAMLPVDDAPRFPVRQISRISVALVLWAVKLSEPWG